MSKKTKEIKDEEVKPVKKKKQTGLIIFLSILAFIVIVGSIFLPFIFVIGVSLFMDENVEYKELSESKIKIPKYNMTLETLDTRYDEEDKCYVMNIKVDKEETKKSKNSFFITTDLEVNYIFKDKDGYIIGENTLYVSNLDKYGKWKLDSSYCSNNASQVVSYEIESINMY